MDERDAEDARDDADTSPRFVNNRADREIQFVHPQFTKQEAG